jgi:ABC-type lipoprotein release transport system permease subunit
MLIAGKQPKLEGAMLILGIAATMTVVGVIATIQPARRGLSVQPTEALKGE